MIRILTMTISGEKFGYHPVTFGLYLDQIVRHVDKRGRNLAQYFQDEMAEPFGKELFSLLAHAI